LIGGKSKLIYPIQKYSDGIISKWHYK